MSSGRFISLNTKILICWLSLFCTYPSFAFDAPAPPPNPLLSAIEDGEALPVGVEGKAKTKVELLERYATYLLFRIQQLERRVADAEEALDALAAKGRSAGGRGTDRVLE